jgi:hypothetical protein
VAELEIDEVRQMIEEALANPPRKKPPVRRKKA